MQPQINVVDDMVRWCEKRSVRGSLPCLKLLPSIDSDDLLAAVVLGGGILPGEGKDYHLVGRCGHGEGRPGCGPSAVVAWTGQGEYADLFADVAPKDRLENAGMRFCTERRGLRDPPSRSEIKANATVLTILKTVVVIDGIVDIPIE